MRAVVVRGPNDFGLEEVPEPTPGDYEALVRISHCGICTATDRHIIAGPAHFPRMQPLPTILGHESIGAITALGPNVRYLKEGDIVLRPGAVRYGETLGGFSGSFGGMAEWGLVADARAIIEDTPRTQAPPLPRYALSQQVVPPDFDPVGAGMFITFKETLSWAQDFGVGVGARVAVIGTGGVGLCLMRACKLLGAATVIALGRRQWPLQQALDQGADQTVDITQQSPLAGIQAATGGALCTHVIDAVGDNALLQQGIGLLADGGRLGQYGIPPIRRTDLDWSGAPRNVSLHFINPNEARVHDLALGWLRMGLFKPLSLVDLVLPLEDVHQAFDLLDKRYATRITLSMGESGDQAHEEKQ